MRKTLPVALGLALAGCHSQAGIPYYGKYEGGFIVHTVPGVNSVDKASWSLKGYLQLLAFKDQFNIHLEGRQQIIDVKGNWRLEPRQITLQVTSIKFDDGGGAEKRNPNLPYIPAEDFKAAYAKEITLRIGKDKDRVTLTGPTLSMGSILGQHEFLKDPRGH